MPNILGINPIIEALEAGKSIDKIYILTGKKGAAVSRIYRLARSQQIPIVQTPREKMDKLSAGQKNQGVIALSPAIDYVHLEDLVDKIHRAGKVANLVILDHLNDPQNFGAIIRSAEIFGSQGIVFSIRESAPITESVIRASAGAIFHLDVCKVTNLASAISYLKKCGVWVFAASSHTSKSYWEMDFTSPQAIIIGSEGKGIRQLLLEKSDDTFRIPQSGKTESLNASAAAGIILAEVFRQRHHMPANQIKE